ncbi:MAG: hypothetical protein P1R58_12180 [bacterium]|nr:hypothetical protein [bacterium]
MFDFDALVNLYSNDGALADTIGFTSLVWTGSGMPFGFNAEVAMITIGPIGAQHTGKSICLDSSFYGGTGIWKWSESGAISYFPNWDGPHCFLIGENTVSYSGNLYYLDPVPPDTNPVPARNIRIEMWDDDFSFDDSIAFTITDDSGYYEFVDIDNSDASGGLDVYFKIVPENENSFVTYEVNPTSIDVYQTSVLDDVIAGTYVFDKTMELDRSAPFFITSMIDSAQALSSQLIPSDPNPRRQVIHNPMFTESYCLNSIMHIESSTSNGPDSFNEDVIFHEYGHHIEEYKGFCDCNPGWSHEWDEQTTIEQAA